MSETQSPLSRLVLFIVGLAIAGSIVAGVHYFVIDLPQQNAMQPPTNDSPWPNENPCKFKCNAEQNSCRWQDSMYNTTQNSEQLCRAQYYACVSKC